MAAVPRLCLSVAGPLVDSLVVLMLRVVVPEGLFALCGQSQASAWPTSWEVGMKFQQVPGSWCCACRPCAVLRSCRAPSVTAGRRCPRKTRMDAPVPLCS